MRLAVGYKGDKRIRQSYCYACNRLDNKHKKDVVGEIVMYSVIIYGFPTYLIFFELLVRSFSGFDTSAFIGPTLGAAGLGFLMSVIQPKPVILTDEQRIFTQQHGVIIRNPNDERIISIAWIFIFIGVLLWYCACLVSLKYPNFSFSIFPAHLIIGLINYLIGIILSVFKDKV